MSNPNRFYTYAYLREDRTPYYIGKGQTNRLFYKSKSGDIKPPKDKSRIIFLKQNLTEEEAFKHEIYIIAVFGRKDLGTGILRNRTNGGDGVSGKIWSISEKKLKSQSYRGVGNPFYNKTHSTKVREKMRDIHSKEYFVVDSNGNVYDVKNLKHFCKENTLDYTSMSKVANKTYKHGNSYKGWSVEKVTINS